MCLAQGGRYIQSAMYSHVDGATLSLQIVLHPFNVMVFNIFQCAQSDRRHEGPHNGVGPSDPLPTVVGGCQLSANVYQR